MRSGSRVPKHSTLSRNQGGGTLLIWAGIWTDGRTELHIRRGTMNSERYVNVLEQHILPLSEQLGDPSTWFLMDDNATCHRSAVVQTFKSQSGIRTIPWPALSPDLSPIENVWSLLKRNVRRSLQPHHGFLDLEILLTREWETLSVNRQPFD